MKKKAAAVLMSVAMTVTCLAGCGGQPQESSAESKPDSTQSNDTGTSDNNSEEESKTEAGADGGSGQELKTLRILAPDKHGVDLDGNSFYLSDWVNGESRMYDELERQLAEHGLKVELDLIKDDQWDDILPTLVLNGVEDYDIINWKWSNAGGPEGAVDPLTLQAYIEQGKLVSVNEIWDNYCSEETKAFLKEYEPLIRANARDDGKNYYLVNLTQQPYKDGDGSSWGNMLGLMIRQDWLDQVNMEMPKTTEELYQALKAFQENDVNGNGVADEVMVLDFTNTVEGGVAGCFGIPQTDKGFLACEFENDDWENGRAQYTSPWYQKDKMVAYINYLKKLYDEGLLDLSGAQQYDMVKENKVSVWNNWWVAAWDEPSILVSENTTPPQYVGFTVDAGTGAVPRVPMTYGTGLQDGYVVTSSADKEAVARLQDYVLTDEFQLLTDWGIEGYTYNIEDGKKVKVQDSDISEVQYISQIYALWVLCFPYGQKVSLDGQIDDAMRAGYTNGYPETGFAQKAQANREWYENPARKANMTYFRGDVEALMTSEETAKYNELVTDLTTYSTETIVNMILGKQSVDEYDSCVEQLKELGMDEIIAIKQAQYDRVH